MHPLPHALHHAHQIPLTSVHLCRFAGDHLRSSWLEVLKCISQLEKLQLIGSGEMGLMGYALLPSMPQRPAPCPSPPVPLAPRHVY